MSPEESRVPLELSTYFNVRTLLAPEGTGWYRGAALLGNPQTDRVSYRPSLGRRTAIGRASYRRQRTF